MLAATREIKSEEWGIVMRLGFCVVSLVVAIALHPSARADGLLLGGTASGNTVCYADANVGVESANQDAAGFLLGTRRCISTTPELVPLYAALVQNYYSYHSNFSKMEELNQKLATISSSTTSIDARMTALDNAMKEQQAKLYESLQSELIAKLNNLPMDLAKDDQAYALLKARLMNDFKEVFAKPAQ